MQRLRPDGDGNQVSWDEVYPHLFQGSRPLPGSEVHDMGMQVLVMCIDDWQIDASNFPGLVDVIYCPLTDAPNEGIKDGDVERAWEAARKIAVHVQAGRNVFVQCHSGQNRSGFVNGIAITLLSGMSGEDAVRLIQSCRANSLWNKHFVDELRTIQAKT